MGIVYHGQSAQRVFYGDKRIRAAYAGGKLIYYEPVKFWNSPYPDNGFMWAGWLAPDTEGYASVDPCYLWEGCIYKARSGERVFPEFSDFTDLWLRGNGDFYMPQWGVTDSGGQSLGYQNRVKVAENIKSAMNAGVYATAVDNDNHLWLFTVEYNEDSEGKYTESYIKKTDITDRITGTPTLLAVSLIKTAQGAYFVQSSGDVLPANIPLNTDRIGFNLDFSRYGLTVDTTAKHPFIVDGDLYWVDSLTGTSGFIETTGKKWSVVSGTAIKGKDIFSGSIKSCRAFAIDTDEKLYSIRVEDSTSTLLSPWVDSLQGWTDVLSLDTFTGDNYFYGIINGCLYLYADGYSSPQRVGSVSNFAKLMTTGTDYSCFAKDVLGNLFYVEHDTIKRLGGNNAET